MKQPTKIVAAGGASTGTADDGSAPIKVGGKYNVTPPVLTDGNISNVQLDANGNLKVTQATLQAGEDITNDVQKVEQRFSYQNITTQATTVIKQGPGVLHAIDFTAVASGVIKLYDGITAVNLFRTITTPAVLLQNEQNKVLDISFATGLTVVTSGANQDILISFR